MKKDLKYRSDINGLRGAGAAIAVAYHAFPNVFVNGFIMLDVFFIISGFLITGIVLSNLEQNNFTFADFFGRRIRRIFPALIVVLPVVLIFGYFNLFPYEFQQLAKHTVGSSGFFVNILFWREAGYFDNPAHTKPLLHLWSLSIEEQFYIIFPFLIFLLYKRKFNLLSIFILLWAISFSYNLYEYKRDPAADFYSLFTRFWEFLTGSILSLFAKNNTITALSKKHSTANIISLLGAVLIAWGLTPGEFGWISSKTHPGIGALLPVIGTAMIIAGNGKSIINRILNQKWLIYIGLISYPLYIWHYPILSYLSILTNNFNFRTNASAIYLHINKLLPSLSAHDINTIIAVAVKFAAISLAVFLSCITYHYVEKKMRSGRNEKIQNTKTIVLSVMMAMLLTTSFALYKLTPVIDKESRNLYQLASYKDGFKHADQNCLDYANGKIPSADRFNEMRPYRFYYCKFNDVASNKTIGLMGTSVAYAAYHGMANYLATKNINTLYITGNNYIYKRIGRCSNRRIFGSSNSIFGVYPPNLTNDEKQECIMREKEMLEILVKSNIKHIFITSHYDFQYQPMLDMFRQHNIKVYIITPFPTLALHPRNCITKKWPYNEKPSVGCATTLPPPISQVEKIKNLKHATIIDSPPAFCPNGICKAFDEKGVLLYSDKIHFSEVGSELLTERVLAPYFDKIAEEN